VAEADNAANGSVGWTYTLDDSKAQYLAAGQQVTETYTITIDDQNGSTTTQDVVITITGTNDAPVAVADTASGTENQTLTIDVLANDTDADDGHVFTLMSGTAPTSEGTVTVDNNQLVFTPGSDFDHLKAGATEQVTLNYTMKDDQGTTSTSSVTVTVTGTNDGPILADITKAAAVQEAADASAQNLAAITGNLSVTDLDVGDTLTATAGAPTLALSNGTLTDTQAAALTAALGTDRLSFDSAANSNGGSTTIGYTYDASSANLDFLREGQSLTVTYDVKVNDGHADSGAQQLVFTITGTNDAPVLAASSTLAYVENQAPTAINPAISVGDVDSTTLSGATVAITGAFAAGQDVLGFTAQNGITGGYDAGTGVLTLSGSSSVANYEAALRSVTYSNSSDNPSTAARTVSFHVDDGAATNHAGNIATSSITVAAVNDAATLSSDTKNLVETNSVLTTAGTLTVNDVDGPSSFQSQSNTAGTYGTFSIGVNGAWTYATTTPHNEFVSGSTYTDNFQVHSADGTATSVTINIAGTDETAIAITAISTDSGSSSTDFVTNDTSLTVSGSHGTLNAGEKIQVSIDGGANWTDVTSTTATAWSYTDPASHATSFDYQARVVDSTGGAGSTASRAVTIDTTADAGPAATLAVGDTLVNNTEKPAVNYTVAGLDTDATAVVTISDGTHTSTHTYAANGAYAFDLSGFNDGAITSSMVITDIAGNTKNVTGQSTTLDTTADAGTKATVVLNDGDGYINKAETGAASYTISGVDGDATATVRFSDGNAAHDVVVNGLGNATATVNLAGLTDGPITASVSVSDTAGNLATGTSDSSVKDATSPTLTSVALQNPATATTSADILVFRVTFSEAVSGVDAADFVVSGTTAGVSAVASVTTGVYDVTVSGGDLANLNGTVGLALKSANGGATMQDVVGNALTNFATTGTSASYTVTNVAPDTTADAGATLRLTGVTSTTGANTFATVSLAISGFDSDLTSATITLKDTHGDTATHTLSSAELTTAKSNGNDGTVTITSWSNLATLNKNDTITATIDVKDATGNTASHSGTFDRMGNLTAPAGAAGEPIQLALFDPQDHAGLVTVHVANLPAEWTLSEGSRNVDGTWTVQTADPSKLAATSPADFAGAVPLQVSMQWTNADGSGESTLVTDNVEVYAPGAPIFALSADDNLTASSAADLLVFAQPIAQDTIYSFDTAADRIDLIGFTGINGVVDLSIADDASGNAVITLANGSTITVVGVHAASLTADHFVFNVAPTTNNTGTLTISDGAMMPFGGVLNNSGTIDVQSAGSDTRLEVLVESLTLKGGGHLTLSDSDHNNIVGGASSAKLVNIDNTISGAGQLGAGQLTLDNHGTILADGSHALVIDSGANTMTNTGTLEATGSGGLVIDSALDNSGTLWANGGNVTVHGDVTGSGSAEISGGSALELDGAANVAVSFDQGGTGSLKLGDAAHFSGSIAGFGGDATLHLTDIAVNGGTIIEYAADPSGSGGVLTLGDGSSVAHLALQGSYANAGFLGSADQAGGMLVTANVADANQNLHGGAGTDILVTGAGNDILAGGAGCDLLSGGGGADTFVFDSAPDGVGNIDTILDFKANGDADHLLLSQQAFGSLFASDGSLDATQFAQVGDGSGGSATLDAAVHVIYDSQTGNLYYDADGADTAGGRSVFAVLGGTGHHPVTIDHHDIELG
jgi:VCBS repeat-containing protein